MYILLCSEKYKHICIYVCVSLYIYICTYTLRISIHTHTHIYIYIYIYIKLYLRTHGSKPLELLHTFSCLAHRERLPGWRFVAGSAGSAAELQWWHWLILKIYCLVVSTPLKNMKVSWDYYSQLNGKIENVPNHQSIYDYHKWTYGNYI